MRRGPFRLPTGGRVDRGKPVGFRLDGKKLAGLQGDTLASALLANGITLVGRSFKYHRPRGFLSAGVEEPNGLFTLGDDGRTEPNVAGTTVELVDGLVARRQNGWPSVTFDLMAVNSLASPLLGAGFYYKTFMGPTRRAWMFYERFIRRAAGLGRAVHERDPDRYETRHSFADVLVIGAGPAGLSAALASGRAGARVVLVEQDALLGGSLLVEDANGPANEWLSRAEAELKSLPNVDILLRTTATGLYDGNTVALVQRRDHMRPDPEKGEARQIVTTLHARAIVFTTGATERPVMFANNDRPGVMLASAARVYLNRFAVAAGARALVVTNNDGAYATAFDLSRRGVAVTIADSRSSVNDLLVTAARSHAVDLLPDTRVSDVRGRKGVRGVVLASGKRGSQPIWLECDLVCTSGGWSPNVHLTSHGGVKPRYREDIAAFVPGELAAGHFGAGALNGSFSTTAAVREGIEAGRRACEFAGHVAPNFDILPPVVEDTGSAMEASWHWSSARSDKVFIDFQNDVTASDLAIAHQEGYESVEHLKRYTTLGMGTDQGKTSNINALAIACATRGLAIPASGTTTTFRPPFTPVAIGALAGRSVGKHFRPIRRSPLHDWHLCHGAEFMEAGPWLRAWWYGWAGSTRDRAYVEEMRQVRTSVGIADASTLGKIDVQGPDASDFLGRVYVNDFAGLPVGKARYGVMLTDDGAVLDDGTTTRLSENRYFMTTTTAHAAEVMSWLEFLLQTAWTDLKVQVTSVTDEWAAMVVAGPNARAAIELALPGEDLSDSRLPYMGCLEVDFESVRLRLIRLSFSGELAYEVYVPADYGVAFWEHVLRCAAPLRIQSFGLETVAALRIEKGHVAGLELDHRNTLDDLGLGKMVSRKKAFVGRELRQRPALQSSQRWSLVGLECLEAGVPLRCGSILFAATDKVEGHGRGYVTSVTWSIELRKYIALALYKEGASQAGTEVVCAHPLQHEYVRALIVSPVFIDPKGERLRA